MTVIVGRQIERESNEENIEQLLNILLTRTRHTNIMLTTIHHCNDKPQLNQKTHKKKKNKKSIKLLNIGILPLYPLTIN